MEPNHFAVHPKVTQYSKSTILQLGGKKKTVLIGPMDLSHQLVSAGYTSPPNRSVL